MDSHEDRKRRLIEEMKNAGGEVGLQKDTSNLFRDREGQPKKKLNVRDFCHVLEVNAAEGWVEVEGMTTFEKLVDETLKFNVLPAVVPQLKSITIGGAISGVGIEASSFRYGLVHETILEMDVLLADGTVVHATPTNEYKDLFFGIPNSYGTLGYILKCRAKVIPAKKYVHLKYQKFTDGPALFKAVETACQSPADYVDGVVFNPKEMYLIIGTFTDDAEYANDYTFMKIFFRSIQKRKEDYLTAKDFIWRWDTDWFWCSKNLGMHNPLVRLIMGRKRLNSITYGKIMRWNARTKFSERTIERFRGSHSESVIQDICIPISHSPAFLDFLLKEIPILPIWICPTKSPDENTHFSLFPFEGNQLHIDFGFWDIIRTKEPHERGYFNRKVERKTMELQGMKSLYSEAFYDRETFDRLYNAPVYSALKQKYDSGKRLKDLYAKCVLRA